MRVRAMFLVLGLWLCRSTVAQDIPKAEVFAGYSYLNVDGNPRQSANGWEVSASGNLNRWLAIETDVSGYYKSFDFAGATVLRFQEYGLAAGPRFNFRPVFVHALAGAAFEHTNFLGSTE